MTTLDSQRGDVAVVMVAGGAGLRLRTGVPKALQPLAGEPLLVHAARGVFAAGCVGCLVVAAPPGLELVVRELLEPLLPPSAQLYVVGGGAQRQGSVAAGLAVLPTGFDIVLVHDAARALTPPAQVTAVAAAVRAGHQAVTPVLPVTDTIIEVGAAGEMLGQPDRSVLRAVQTPQGFRRAVLTAAHHSTPAGGHATDDAGLVARSGVPVHTIAGSSYALKITTRYDLIVAESLLANGRTEPLRSGPGHGG